MKNGTALPHVPSPSGGLIHVSEFVGQVQRGIPIPKKRSGPVSKYRAKLCALEVGDSFFVVDGRGQTAGTYAKEYGITITTRRIGNGIRIWRTA